MSTLQELKIDSRISTQRAARQWKKDMKATYMPLLEMKTKLSKVLEERERRKSQKAEKEKLRAKFEKEEQFRRKIQQQKKGTLERRDESRIGNGRKENNGAIMVENKRVFQVSEIVLKAAHRAWENARCR